MPKPREPKFQPREPSPSDVWQAETNEKCARAIAGWLKHTVNVARPINTLKLPELIALTEHCLSVYQVEVSKRTTTATTPKEIEKIVETFLA